MNQELLFKDRLRSTGERVTSARISIFRSLLRGGPIPMSKLIDESAKDGIDPVTVYRTLSLFRQLGLVQELGLGRNRRLELSDDYHAHHHHFTCTICGKVSDFDSATIEDDLKRIGQELGHDVQSHQLEVVGVCAGCRSRPL